MKPRPAGHFHILTDCVLSPRLGANNAQQLSSPSNSPSLRLGYLNARDSHRSDLEKRNNVDINPLYNTTNTSKGHNSQALRLAIVLFALYLILFSLLCGHCFKHFQPAECNYLPMSTSSLNSSPRLTPVETPELEEGFNEGFHSTPIRGTPSTVSLSSVASSNPNSFKTTLPKSNRRSLARDIAARQMASERAGAGKSKDERKGIHNGNIDRVIKNEQQNNDSDDEEIEGKKHVEEDDEEDDTEEEEEEEEEDEREEDELEGDDDSGEEGGEDEKEEESEEDDQEKEEEEKEEESEEGDEDEQNDEEIKDKRTEDQANEDKKEEQRKKQMDEHQQDWKRQDGEERNEDDEDMMDEEVKDREERKRKGYNENREKKKNEAVGKLQKDKRESESDKEDDEKEKGERKEEEDAEKDLGEQVKESINIDKNSVDENESENDYQNSNSDKTNNKTYIFAIENNNSDDDAYEESKEEETQHDQLVGAKDKRSDNKGYDDKEADNNANVLGPRDVDINKEQNGFQNSQGNKHFLHKSEVVDVNLFNSADSSSIAMNNTEKQDTPNDVLEAEDEREGGSVLTDNNPKTKQVMCNGDEMMKERRDENKNKSNKLYDAISHTESLHIESNAFTPSENLQHSKPDLSESETKTYLMSPNGHGSQRVKQPNNFAEGSQSTDSLIFLANSQTIYNNSSMEIGETKKGKHKANKPLSTSEPNLSNTHIKAASNTKRSYSDGTNSRLSAASDTIKSPEIIDDVLARESMGDRMSVSFAVDSKQVAIREDIFKSLTTEDAKTVDHTDDSSSQNGTPESLPVDNNDCAMTQENSFTEVRKDENNQSTLQDDSDGNCEDGENNVYSDEANRGMNTSVVLEAGDELLSQASIADSETVEITNSVNTKQANLDHNLTHTAQACNAHDYSLVKDNMTSQESNNAIVAQSKQSAYMFDDSIESSYFALFQTHASLATPTEDRTGEGASHEALDRPVVQNIVNDFHTQSQNNMNSQFNKYLDKIVSGKTDGSILETSSSHSETNKETEEIVRSVEGKQSTHALRDRPQSAGSVDNNPDRSKGTGSESKEDNHADNYDVTMPKTAYKADVAATAEKISENDETNAKPLPASLIEPQSQSIDRVGDTQTGKESPTPDMDNEHLDLRADINKHETLKSSNHNRPARRSNGSAVRISTSPGKTSSVGANSKQILLVSQPVEELRAIDRIRLGPYSQSNRSPRHQAVSPRKHRTKVAVNNNKTPIKHSALQTPKIVRNRQTDALHGKSSAKNYPMKSSNKNSSSGTKSISDQDKHQNAKGFMKSIGLKENLLLSSPPETVVTSDNGDILDDERTVFGKEPDGAEFGKHNIEENSEDKKNFQKLAEQKSASKLIQESNDVKLFSNGEAGSNVERGRLLLPKASIEEPIIISKTTEKEKNLGYPISGLDNPIKAESKDDADFHPGKIQSEAREDSSKKIELEAPKTESQSLLETQSSKDALNVLAAPKGVNGVVITTTQVSPISSKSTNKNNAETVASKPFPIPEKGKIVAKSKPLNKALPLTPTTVIIEDETSDIDTSTKSKAGRVVLNSIQKKIRENAVSSAVTSSSSTPAQGRATSPSPENSLGSSIASRAGILRPAAKTTSMSSLTVPHGLTGVAHPHSADDDTLSLTSRLDSTRPSFDASSRRSVDYRIRTTATVVQVASEPEKSRSMLTRDESYIKSAIPYLPLSLAVTCLVLNILLPGLGTIVSGVSLLCCGRARLSTKPDQTLTIVCTNCMVGLAQLFTVTFMLVGWFWAIGWGIHLVSLSGNYDLFGQRWSICFAFKSLSKQALAFICGGNLWSEKIFRRKILPAKIDEMNFINPYKTSQYQSYAYLNNLWKRIKKI
ncbi:nipped-b-like protein b [Plakobranchus ocellatus]|uniref:Nipped-b-like protein b n=1 Tax=Plakobranchus ocellatus TaxID=259542 RepID=A0AAV4CLA4_9GAST|nr:nipped-b-like protein b [Plakobranchus ocellatus]